MNAVVRLNAILAHYNRNPSQKTFALCIDYGLGNRYVVGFWG